MDHGMYDSGGRYDWHIVWAFMGQHGLNLNTI